MIEAKTTPSRPCADAVPTSYLRYLKGNGYYFNGALLAILQLAAGQIEAPAGKPTRTPRPAR